MNLSKKFIFRVIFTTEIFLFSFFYLFSTNGMSAVFRLRRENNMFNKQLQKEREEIMILKNQLEDWKTSLFNQEKIAREKLQMIKPGEIVYFL